MNYFFKKTKTSKLLNSLSEIICPAGPLEKITSLPPLPYLPEYNNHRAIFRLNDGDEVYGLGSDTDIKLSIVKAIAEAMERYYTKLQYTLIKPAPPFGANSLHLTLSSNSDQSTKTRWLRGLDDANNPIWISSSCNNNILKTTNGVAAHIDFSKALSNAMLELIERDAFLVRWLCQLSPIKIDLDTINNDFLNALIMKIRNDGGQIHLFDIALDIPVPTVAVLVKLNESYFIGTSSSWTYEEAIIHSFVEISRGIGKMKQSQNLSTKQAYKKIQNSNQSGHSEYHWSLKNNDSFDFMINTTKSARYTKLAKSTHMIRSFRHLKKYLNKKGQKWYFFELANKNSGGSMHVVRCILPSLQGLFFGNTTMDKVNQDRLGKVCSKWFCDIPHPIS